VWNRNAANDSNSIINLVLRVTPTTGDCRLAPAAACVDASQTEALVPLKAFRVLRWTSATYGICPRSFPACILCTPSPCRALLCTSRRHIGHYSWLQPKTASFARHAKEQASTLVDRIALPAQIRVLGATFLRRGEGNWFLRTLATTARVPYCDNGWSQVYLRL